jgi:hypothetical protein
LKQIKSEEIIQNLRSRTENRKQEEEEEEEEEG